MQNKSDKPCKARKLKKINPNLLESLGPRGYDPELLYVECGRCGAPVLWEPGRATRLLAKAGVDPIELDASCMLMTDACPACGSRDEYNVRICRICDQIPSDFPPSFGHA